MKNYKTINPQYNVLKYYTVTLHHNDDVYVNNVLMSTAMIIETELWIPKKK